MSSNQQMCSNIRNIQIFSRQNQANSTEKKFWFFKRNESFEENQFFTSDAIRNLINSEWSQVLKNIENLKRSLLLIYKEFEYNHFQNEEYHRIKQETEDDNNIEAIQIIRGILQKNGIEMLIYDSEVSEIYNELRQISEMFFCTLFKPKLLTCSKLVISVSEDTCQIDSMMEDEVEQSLLQQKIIEIFAENGIYTKRISFIGLEKVITNGKILYTFYFDIIEKSMYETALKKQIALSLGRKLFNSSPILQENTQHNFVNIAVFEKKLYFSLASKQTPQEQLNFIVYRITGTWSDNIEDVELAKDDQLYYFTQINSEIVNHLQVPVKRKKGDIQKVDVIKFNDIDYEYYIKIAQQGDNQFKFFTFHQSQNLIDSRCIHPQMMQIILLQKYAGSIYDLNDRREDQGESTIDFLHLSQVQSSQANREQNQNQEIQIEDLSSQQQIFISNNQQNHRQNQEQTNFFKNYPQVTSSVVYIQNLFGLNNIETIYINKKKSEGNIENFLQNFYENKVYNFEQVNEQQLKESFYTFYKTFSNLPLLSQQNLVERLTQEHNVREREYREKQIQNPKSKILPPKERRIKQIDFIQKYCLKNNKQLFFLRDYNEIKQIIDQNNQYQEFRSLAEEEYFLVQNIFIHLFSIDRYEELFKYKKIILNNFPTENQTEDKVLQETSKFLQVQPDSIKIFYFKYIIERKQCVVYFDCFQIPIKKQIDKLIKQNQVSICINLLGNKVILPIRYLKSEKNDVINRVPEDQYRYNITYYSTPVQYQLSIGVKHVYCQIIGEKHEGKLDVSKMNDGKIDQRITFMEKDSFLNGDTTYLRDLIQTLNRKNQRIQQQRRNIAPIVARSVVFESNQILTLNDNQLLHQTDVQGQLRLKGYYIKPNIKDLTKSYKFYEFNSEGIYDPGWWLTGWPILYRSVYDQGDEKGNFFFSDNPQILISSKEQQLKGISEKENPNIFYICSIDPLFDNFQIIESNHIAKIPYYYCRKRCIIVQRGSFCSVF